MSSVAIQGEPGSFSAEAAHALLGPGVDLRCCTGNDEVTRLLAAGAVDAAVLPVENSLAGSVLATYDAILAEPDVVATAQLVLPIHHCLLARPGATLAELTTVESHPVALAQCRAFLARHPRLRPRAGHDTAGAARDVREAGDPARAAIASAHAATQHGLAVLAHDIEDRPDNRTRFLLLRRGPAGARPSADGRVHSMVVYETANVPGALLRTLEPIAARGMNMVKIESRPAGAPWQYRFIVEVEHDGGADGAAALLEALRPHTRALRLVGTFEPTGAPVA